ncbi:hypothetical protein EWM64_g5462 [Hericium alpestre]|uniref:Uncharacterized protein n=1 Tax=Hericium alpestre TaxID=135208 RepID=A0A4Y9ZYI0_9AGAM|nr:hypothetical protein EWM64_g5462 [Hericium alpestre]
MQPVAAVEGEGVRKVRGEVQEGPVNVEGWWKRSEGSVPVDQLFFHRYFSQKHQKEQAMAAKVGKRKTKHGEDDEDMDSDADEDEEGEKADEKEEDEEESDAEEAEIWKAMKASMPELAGGDDDDDLMNDSDSDDIPSGLDAGYSDSEPEPDAKSGPEDDEDEEEDADGADADADAFSLVEASDAEDLIDLDADAPDGLIDFEEDASDAEAEEWTGFGGETATKRKRGKDDGEKDKRKKLKSLPTFASYEDYAKMIDDGVEDII